ncbi:hypothetical protein NGM37_48070, partial [Streptomyces sp. TRM76130]|nr:hypothetical protein [Streptomyces sp. TRM76130]
GVVQQLESPAGRAELTEAGVRGPYQLVPRNSGTSATPQYLIPSVQVQAERAGAAEADTAVQRIIDVYTRHVADIQDAQDVAPSLRISASVLVAPSAAPVRGARSRALAGTALLGTTATVLAALWCDRCVRRRGKRTGSPADPLSRAGGMPVAG